MEQITPKRSEHKYVDDESLDMVPALRVTSQVEDSTKSLLAKVSFLENELTQLREHHARELKLVADSVMAKMQSAAPKHNAEVVTPVKRQAAVASPDLFYSSPQKINDYLSKKVQELETVIDKQQNAYESLQARMKHEVEKHVADAVLLRNRIEELRDQVRENEQRALHAEKAFEEKRQRDAYTLQEQSKIVVNQQNNRISKLQNAYGSSSTQQTIAQLNRIHEQTITAVRDECRRHQDSEVQRIKEQNDALFNAKCRELQQMSTEFAAYKQNHNATVKAFTAENNYLYDYVAKLTTLFQNMDNGWYPIIERTGIKTYKVPAYDLHSIKLDPTRLPHLEERIRQVHHIISTHNLQPNSLPYIVDPHAEGKLHAMLSLDVAPQSPPSPIAASAQSNLDEDITEITNLQKLTLNQLRARVIALRNAVLKQQSPSHAAKVPSACADQRVIDELANDKTINYIKAVEEERDHYRNLMLEDNKRLRELRVAYDSQSRTIQRLQSASSSELRSFYGGETVGGGGQSQPKRHSQSTKYLREQIRVHTSLSRDDRSHMPYTVSPQEGRNSALGQRK